MFYPFVITISLSISIMSGEAEESGVLADEFELASCSAIFYLSTWEMALGESLSSYHYDLLLRPGGTVSVLPLNPLSPSGQKYLATTPQINHASWLERRGHQWIGEWHEQTSHTVSHVLAWFQSPSTHFLSTQALTHFCTKPDKNNALE